MSLVRQWTSSEIGKDRVLQLYGVFLSITHVITSLFWTGGSIPFSRYAAKLERINARDGGLMCLPSFTGCGWLQSTSQASLSYAVSLYGLIALATAVLFWRQKRLTLAYCLLTALTVFEFGLLLTNMSLLPNYYYMVLIISLAYLCLPTKRILIPYCLVTFYVAAGFLKLNQEWLSGAALLVSPPVWLPTSLFHALLAAAVVFETIVSLGLLSRRFRWLSFATAVLFHLLSYQQVGIYYPAIMLCLLVIFPLAWQFDPEAARAASDKKLSRSAALFLMALVLLQIVPRFLSSDVALTGQSRALMLNMFDANAKCESQFVIRLRNHATLELSLDSKKFSVRSGCDPLRFINYARVLCRDWGKDQDFEDVDLSLVSKRTTDISYSRILQLNSVCRSPPDYRVWSKNAWLVDP